MGPISQYRSFKSDLYSNTSPVRLDYIRDIGGFLSYIGLIGNIRSLAGLEKARNEISQGILACTDTGRKDPPQYEQP